MQIEVGRFVWSLAVCVAMSWPVCIAFGQDVLPPELTRVTGPWSSEQRQAVDGFATQWVEQLAADSDATIADARGKLVEPIRQSSSSDSFKNQYSALLSLKLNAPAKNERKMVRLNTMIVASYLVGTNGLEMLQEAVDDSEEAVRYWAAKGIAVSLEKQADVPGGLAASLVTNIDRQLAVEESPNIREQFYLAMARLNTPASRAELIDAMDKQVARYAQTGLNIGLRAEQSGCSRLYSALVTAYFENRAKEAEVREFVIVCTKYVELIDMQLSQGELNEELSPIALDLVQAAELMMNAGVQIYDANSPAGPSLYEPLFTGNYQQFQLNVLDWVKFLQKAKIGIPADELDIPARSAATAAN